MDHWRGRHPPPTLVIFAEAGGACLEEAVEETYFPSQGPEVFPARREASRDILVRGKMRDARMEGEGIETEVIYSRAYTSS